MRRNWGGCVEGTAGVRLKSPHFNDLAYPGHDTNTNTRHCTGPLPETSSGGAAAAYPRTGPPGRIQASEKPQKVLK